jgi:hypothetical protein
MTRINIQHVTYYYHPVNALVDRFARETQIRHIKAKRFDLNSSECCMDKPLCLNHFAQHLGSVLA